MESTHDAELIRYINLKLAALGQPPSERTADAAWSEIAGPLLRNYYQKNQLLGTRLCPVDTRIQTFLDSYLDAPGDDILASVGGYQLEGLGAQLFDSVEGDYFSIIGLPLLAVLAFLRSHGVAQA